jgi:poly(A) polymerase
MSAVKTTLADNLRDAAAVGPAREALAGEGEAWIVGGAVRDALAGRAVIDLDLALDGDEAAAARRIAKLAGGPAFELSSEFGAWRALSADRSWHVDVSRLRSGSIAADLGERDFTANAIALALADLEGELIDPFGGAADIEAKLLRAVSERSFSSDPLRILRAARQAAELGFELDRATLELARACASRAAEPAGERQLAELRSLVAGPDPLRGLALLDELGATAAVLPELDALHGVGQNLNHHLDVYGHTVQVLANLLELERNLDEYAGDAADGARALLAEPLADELSRGEALRFGAILHDIGKPLTRQERENGIVSFIGHDREGATLVREACARLKTSRALSRHLEALTLHHLHLGFMTHERPLSRRRLYEYLRLTDPVAADVTLLTVSDRLAARGGGPTASAEMIEAHLELVREVLPAALAWHRDGPPPAPIAGDELAAAVGIEPGPELGRLLAEIEAAVFTGEVESAEDAIAVARAALREPRAS